MRQRWSMFLRTSYCALSPLRRALVFSAFRLILGLQAKIPNDRIEAFQILGLDLFPFVDQQACMYRMVTISLHLD